MFASPSISLPPLAQQVYLLIFVFLTLESLIMSSNFKSFMLLHPASHMSQPTLRREGEVKSQNASSHEENVWESPPTFIQGKR